jgi:hypothetical protein
MARRCQSCAVRRRMSQHWWRRISCRITSAPRPLHYLEAQC